MLRICRNFALAAAAGALAVVAAEGALARATPKTPRPGSVIKTSWPLFTWALPSGEQAEEIAVATSSATTVEGALLEENVIRSEGFRRGRRAWRPGRPIPAGRYWWVVRSSDTLTGDTFYSAPAPFAIPLQLSVVGLDTPNNLKARFLYVGVRFRANVERVRVSVQMVARGRVQAATSREVPHRIGRVTASGFRLRSPGVRVGTRVDFRVRLSSGK